MQPVAITATKNEIPMNGIDLIFILSPLMKYGFYEYQQAGMMPFPVIDGV
jgi:hypothetical protein